MAFPGIDSQVTKAVSKAVAKFIWPQRLSIPLSKEFDSPLTMRPIGVLMARSPRITFGSRPTRAAATACGWISFPCGCISFLSRLHFLPRGCVHFRRFPPGCGFARSGCCAAPAPPPHAPRRSAARSAQRVAALCCSLCCSLSAVRSLLFALCCSLCCSLAAVRSAVRSDVRSAVRSAGRSSPAARPAQAQVHVKNARKLVDVNMAPGETIDPYFVLHVEGSHEMSAVRTKHKRNTQQCARRSSAQNPDAPEP